MNYLQADAASRTWELERCLQFCADVSVPLLPRLERLEQIRPQIWRLENPEALCCQWDLCMEQIVVQLMTQSVFYLSPKELLASERLLAEAFFRHSLLPLLSPRLAEDEQQEPVCIYARLRREERTVLGVCAIPGGLPDVLVLPGTPLRVIASESILLEYIGELFPGYTCEEAVRVHRLPNGMAALSGAFSLLPQDLYSRFPPTLRLSEVVRERAAPALLRRLQYPACIPVGQELSSFAITPEETASPLLRGLERAVSSRSVSAIWAAIGAEMLPEFSAMLSAAAEAGKYVTLITSVPTELEKTGCVVLRRPVCGAAVLLYRPWRRTLFFSTEKASGCRLLSAERSACRTGEVYLRSLVAAPGEASSLLYQGIEEQTALGSDGRILLLGGDATDPALLEQLRLASRAGASVSLICEGRCLLLPGLAGETEQVEVLRPDRQLSRGFGLACFGQPGKETLYLSQPGLLSDPGHMLLCPIRERAVREKLLRLLQQIKNDPDLWQMESSGKYQRRS